MGNLTNGRLYQPRGTHSRKEFRYNYLGTDPHSMKPVQNVLQGIIVMVANDIIEVLHIICSFHIS